MSTLTHDTRPRAAGMGLVLALVAAGSFGLSGALADGLLATGWTPITVVVLRLAIGALCLLPFALRDLRGQWRTLAQDWRLVLAYAAFGMALAQLGFFSAVQHMAVGPALLIEYTSPAAVVLWLWLRRGERPTRVTVLGAVIVAAGLVLVLGLLTGARLSLPGVLWAALAMIGGSGYYLLAAHPSRVPSTALTAASLIIGAIMLLAVALTGMLPLGASDASVHFAFADVPWWVPILALGIVSGGIAYSSGIAAVRRLGSRLASFLGILELVFAVGFAWMLLGQTPAPVQVVGGGLVLAGIIVLRLGERAPRAAASTSGTSEGIIAETVRVG
ncbi:MAG TPA: DMT family transporter [Microbacterium sp.]|nr:DMT family transporter [Microbacterium sp.]